MATSPLSTFTTNTTTFDAMAGSPDAHNFLKMEDVHTSSPSVTFETSTTSDPTGAEMILVHSKAAKKRKSWGQELPEPKTSLPPRKRAKTEDEKEQRRIERIKRNRAAAHNSRERKRQETETYAMALARANAELAAYRKHFGQLPASVVLPEVTLATVAEDAPTPVPSLMDSRSSLSAPSPASPALVDDLFESTNVVIKQEPDVNFQSAPVFEYPTVPSKPAPALSLLDTTQHPAAMLCDLQCRSRQLRSQSPNNQPSTTDIWWMNFFLTIMTISLKTTYKTILMALWSHSPSRMARMIQASQSRSTSRSTTSSMTPPPLALSRSTVALAQRNIAATRRSVVRQGALALQLQRREVRAGVGKTEGPAAKAEREIHSRSSSDKAFREFGTNGHGSEDGNDQGVGS